MTNKITRLGKRTGFDFSKHTHTTHKYGDSEYGVQIDTLQIGNSSRDFIQFVNSPNGLAVYGDFGNWIFNRPFIPSSTCDPNVSDSYWVEKLNLNSTQKFTCLDISTNVLALQSLQAKVNGLHGVAYSELTELTDWCDRLIEYAQSGDVDGYTYHAYRQTPSCIEDTDEIPYYTTIPFPLKVIFDAFEYMCYSLRLKKESESRVDND